MHGIPVRDRDLHSSQVREILRPSVLPNNNSRAIGVRPRHDLDLHIVVVAHP